MTTLARRLGLFAVVCGLAACPSTTPPDAGFDAGCPGCDLTGCAIEGTVYDAGTLNPATVCQVCAPRSSATGWTDVLAGTSCDAGSVCASGQCLPGCFVDGFYAAADAGNPADSCQLCDPTQSLSAWTTVGADGTTCTGDGGNFCLQGACVSECVIGGVFYPGGTVNPAESCQSCQPPSTFASWSPSPDDSLCNEDGGNLCFGGLCVPGCAIDGGVVPPGSASPTNGCFGCVPLQSAFGATQFPDGTPCSTGGQVCQGGACIDACAIGGVFYADGTVDAGNPNVCCNAAASATSWSPGFAAARSWQTTLEPEAIASGDVNGDRIPDLVVAHPGLGEVGILAGRGGGAFGPEAQVLVGIGPRAVALADLNGDGRTDIAVANGGNSTFAVLLQQADGTLQPGPGSPYLTPPGPTGIAAADVNNDGLQDILICDDQGGGAVTVWLGSADGGFLGLHSFGVGAEPVGLAVADFERDGSPDVATVDVGDSTLALLHNNGPGAFATNPTLITLPASPSAVASADFNGDGFPDVAVAGQGPDGGVVAIYLNQGAAPWLTASLTLVAVDAFPSAIAAADVNGDGIVDLVVTSQTAGTVAVLLNETPTRSATPLFLPPASYGVGRAPTGVAVGQSPSGAYLAVANVGSDFVSVLVGNCR